eukprot:TRINITY_DN4319_c0_g1_i15.p1 TRINITY_DN4319_c0_g1~~TRINITY_DN4319_c0_g1_i15.p1  ORF type:complete len:334 (-),score=53.12 TRINITY_DN4319_c0_g1_i15:134-1135(-)
MCIRDRYQRRVHGYANVKLDAKSKQAFQQSLNKVSDSLARMIIWRNIWDMVRDGQMSSKEFLNFALAQLPHESDESVLEAALVYVDTAITWYIPFEYQEGELNALFGVVMERLKTEKEESIKRHLVAYLILFAGSGKHKKVLVKWLKEGTGILGLTLSQANRYSIIKKIYGDARFSLEEKQKLLNAELKEDKSDVGLRAQRTCEASIPTLESKAKQWLQLLSEDTRESEHMLFSAMRGFNSQDQVELLKPYEEKYFETITDIFKKKTRYYAEAFFRFLKPRIVSESVLKRFEEIKAKVSEEDRTLKKLTIEEVEDIKRMLRAQKLYLIDIKKA